ncbi:hypothetical protein D3C74_459740 [compost metagenome]
MRDYDAGKNTIESAKKTRIDETSAVVPYFPESAHKPTSNTIKLNIYERLQTN